MSMAPRIDVDIGLARKIVAIGIDVIGLVDLVRLVQLHAVQVNLLVDHADAVARNAHAALHEGLLRCPPDSGTR